MSMSVTSLHVYPLKGCHGTDLTGATVTPRGFRHDRELMLVDPAGGFLSQRNLPLLALFHVRHDGTALTVTGPDGASFRHPIRTRGPRLPVRVHRSDTVGVDQGDQAARWFGSRLGRACRLVWFPEDQVRPVDPVYATAEVRFADAFPLLVTTQESLADLNARLDQPVPMNRFRPSIVLTGWDRAWAEDQVRVLRIGRVEVELVRRCGRCTVTTVDQDTGVTGPEPLRTLATFRQEGQKLLFGVLGVPRVTGTVSVGDSVEVLEYADGFVPV
ncbi:MAG TPA: MOSC N-terminal beta barrel domain-containing protein [Mycobacteriales bacterium]|jgi:Uncharacterized Fe-S protein